MNRKKEKMFEWKVIYNGEDQRKEINSEIWTNNKIFLIILWTKPINTVFNLPLFVLNYQLSKTIQMFNY